MAKRRRVGSEPKKLSQREADQLAVGRCPDCGLPLDLPDRACAECTHSLRRHLPVATEAGVEESIRFQCWECRGFCSVPEDLHAAMNPVGLLSRTPSDSSSEVEFMLELTSLGAELVELGEMMGDPAIVIEGFPWARLKKASERVIAVEDEFRPVMRDRILDTGELLKKRTAAWEEAPEDHLSDIQGRGEDLAAWGNHMISVARETLPHLSGWSPLKAESRST
jgi:hypothetical protein